MLTGTAAVDQSNRRSVFCRGTLRSVATAYTGALETTMSSMNVTLMESY